MHTSRTTRSINKQDGAVFIVMLVILIMGAAAVLIGSLSSRAIQNRRDEVTAKALAQAKDALIGRAVSDNTMPGRLPCPEDTSLIGTPNEGQALGSCTLPAIGRLPWKSLGLGDLRDANGDKLWYVLSAGFRNSPLNSDTPAQLTVDSVPNKAVAIIFSVGPPINGQSRPIPTSSTPPNITQYLELSNNTGGNAFVSSGPSDTFNDRLLLITHDELFRVVEKRIAGEVKNCLNEYASISAGLYPWASPWNVLTYADTSGTLYGRIPDTPFNDTFSDNSSMHVNWGPRCNISSGSGWWLDWKDMVFYAISDAYSPDQNTGAALLTINPPSTTANKQFVVIVAGKILTTLLQVRGSTAEKTNLNNYLESPNNIVGTTIFAQSGVSATFNDTVVFQ